MTPDQRRDLAAIVAFAALPTPDPAPPIEETTVEIVSVERTV